jgi:hypothetical protein
MYVDDIMLTASSEQLLRWTITALERESPSRTFALYTTFSVLLLRDPLVALAPLLLTHNQSLVLLAPLSLTRPPIGAWWVLSSSCPSHDRMSPTS